VSLREQLNEKPAISAGIVGGILAILAIFVYWELQGGKAPTHSSAQAYYSTDDGKTWFADDFDKAPPFDHNGSQAVRCLVFKCSNSAPFAGYVEEFTQEYHDQRSGIRPVDAQHPPLDVSSNILVKKPGSKDWVLSYTPQGAKIMLVHCPDGSSETPQPVMP
jgi:hypothetical protein